jgi:hypothetical protein
MDYDTIRIVLDLRGDKTQAITNHHSYLIDEINPGTDKNSVAALILLYFNFLNEAHGEDKKLFLQWLHMAQSKISDLDLSTNKNKSG